MNQPNIPIKKAMVSAVNKIALKNSNKEQPSYEMRHIPDEYMIFCRDSWSYIPLKTGVSHINNGIDYSLDKYGLTKTEINAYKRLLNALDIKPNPNASL